MCGKLDCADGGIECPYRHHGALNNDIFKTSLFDFSLASHYNLLPIDIRKTVECQCYSLRFTGSNSWHTYALSFITAYVTYMYKGMLPIHCMMASLWSNGLYGLIL